MLDAARAWLAEDPDEGTRAELAALIALVERGDAQASADLADRFGSRLRFGTAGLRGPMGAGPARMNRAVVIRAAAGLAAYLLAGVDLPAAGPPGASDTARARADPSNTRPPGARGGDIAVVVGYDARHKSEAFALDTCAVLAGAGIRPLLLSRPLPTPVLAYAIRLLGCAAGVMVTASHNPAADNGYKVYLADGCQIVPPADERISAAIDAVGPLASVPRTDSGWEVLGESVIDEYVARVASLPVPGGPRDLRVVYTPLHGVGAELFVRAMTASGFREPVPVAEQAAPDPDFPTVAYPNPEEPGALDLAFATATAEHADLVIANDPDADRCAVAVPLPAPGGWRLLRGDEVGALLALHVLRHRPERTGALACSIVSSSLLGRIARVHGRPFAETLTGFKWIGRVPGLAYGYEEALGYCVDPAAVRDKDGISAGVLVAELAAALHAQGRTLLDALDDLALTYGVHATSQVSLRVAGAAAIASVVGRFVAGPPSTLGGLDVHTVQDLAAGVDGLPPADGLRLYLTDGTRVIVRPSGTEPKVKCYLEAVVDVPPGSGANGLARARAEATRRLTAVEHDLRPALALTATPSHPTS